MAILKIIFEMKCVCGSYSPIKYVWFFHFIFCVEARMKMWRAKNGKPLIKSWEWMTKCFAWQPKHCISAIESTSIHILWFFCFNKQHKPHTILIIICIWLWSICVYRQCVSIHRLSHNIIFSVSLWIFMTYIKVYPIFMIAKRESAV